MNQILHQRSDLFSQYKWHSCELNPSFVLHPTPYIDPTPYVDPTLEW